MALTSTPQISLRTERTQRTLLAWAFAVSLSLHLAIYGTFEAGRKFGWWDQLHWPAWLKSVRVLASLLNKPPPTPPTPQIQDLELTFVDVNPAQATPDPPKESKYYSDKNSRAANPEPDSDSQVPKIDGKQTDMVKTEDVSRTKAFPLQPAVPAEQAKEEQEEQKPKPAEEQKPKPAEAPGDLAMAKPQDTTPQDTPHHEQGTATQERPRTIREALARQPNNQLVGQKMKQEGGVPRRHISSSLDVSSTAFGAYDAKIIYAIEREWFRLLDERNYASERTGRVVLSFRLHADGSISEMHFVNNTVDLALGLLCQSAIKNPAPYDPWPSDMRFKIGAEYREVTFSFLYN